MIGEQFDVAIVGGGPAGATTGSLLKKYNPGLKVVIVERESFPRDHVGESMLPAIGHILNEMGVWQKVEDEGFPIKLGGTYRWGATDELWHLDFVDAKSFTADDRPGSFSGERRETAFHVDRSIYDKVLLDHARDMGCQVLENTAVKEVGRDGDNVTGLVSDSTEPDGAISISARYFVDASGETGVIRRALGIETDIPTHLRNIAFWDYWQDAQWAEVLGRNTTRIQVMSLGWGWLWFIPITASRTSIGLVLPADYYKETGKRPEKLYEEAVRSEPLVSGLVKNANREGRFQTTKDWNFLSSRLAGGNWFLAGDSCGFADPILSAGMTLAHTSGRKVAYSILELLRGELPAAWIAQQYSDGHRAQIRHHIRFTEFWYAGNGRFTDLKAYCSEIAESAGLRLDPDAAFRWLGSGGFALERPGVARASTFSLGSLPNLISAMTDEKPTWAVSEFNNFRSNVEGAAEQPFASYDDGRITPIMCLSRNGKLLPISGLFYVLLVALERVNDIHEVLRVATRFALEKKVLPDASRPQLIIEALEALVAEGWVTATFDPSRPRLEIAGKETAER